MNGVLSLDDASFDGKHVLFRVDINLPLHPETKEFLDDGRLRAITDTLDDLLNSKVVIIGHQSRPGRADFTDLSSHSEKLSKILNRKVKFISDVCGEDAIEAIRDMSDGDIICLDNVRMHPDEISLKNAEPDQLRNSDFVKTLAPEFDAYVTDAFAAAHRSTPSLCGFSEVLPCYAGRLMEREIDALQMAVNDPPRPYVAILGGAKADDSFRVAKNLIDRGVVDTVAFVGVVGNMVLWANGIDIGEGNKNFIRSTLGNDFEIAWSMAESLIENHSSLIFMPKDVAVEVNEVRIAKRIDELPVPYPIYDIGLETLQLLRPILMSAECILWNGPASYFEKPQFAFGTIEVLNMCTETNAMTIVGGGHTSALVNSRGVSDRVTHNSTGGGACLQMLCGDKMPVIEALEQSFKIHNG